MATGKLSEPVVCPASAFYRHGRARHNEQEGWAALERKAQLSGHPPQPLEPLKAASAQIVLVMI